MLRVNDPIKRCLQQLDLLTLLLAAPPRIQSQNNAVDKRRNYGLIGRLAACIDGADAIRIPAYELRSLLSVMAEECKCYGNYPPRVNDDGSMVSPCRERARILSNNNFQSILRFVERIIDQRYGNWKKCNHEDDQFLDDELKNYFGTDDVSSWTEEEILCLAFQMASDKIVQMFEFEELPVNLDKNQTCTVNSKIAVGKNPEAETMRRLRSGIFGASAIHTALRIIDSVVLVNKHERAARGWMQQVNKEVGQYSFKEDVCSRRMKYEHLLQPSKKRRQDRGGIRTMHLELSCENKSIMEEKYQKQWEWLHRLMARCESKMERGVELLKSNDSNNIHLRAGELEVPNLDEGTLSLRPCFASEKNKGPDNHFVIVRQNTETMNDVSLSSTDGDEEIDYESDEELGSSGTEKYCCNPNYQNNANKCNDADALVSATDSLQPGSKLAPSASTTLMPPSAKAVSRDELDQETYELRLALLDMPPGESLSMEVIQHRADEIARLLGQYGALEGIAGISRCGNILGSGTTSEGVGSKGDAIGQFPLIDTMIFSLARVFLTEAVSALRVRAFLHSFVLPLVTGMQPVSSLAASGSGVEGHNNNKGKPASRVLTSLLATLARDRPMECVTSVIAPALVLNRHLPSVSMAPEVVSEPTRFQCELVLRVLRGKDALSVPAITMLVEQILPSTEGTSDVHWLNHRGMKWTEHTIPVLTACLNRRPALTDDVVAKLADEVSCYLSPQSSQSIARSMKFSTLFHTIVTKFGSQVKSIGKVEALKDSAARLKTFMGKAIRVSLKNLS